MSLPYKTSQISLSEIEDIPNNTFLIDDDEEYEQLCSIIKNYLNGDCRALTINEEIIFNSYQPYTSYRNEILDDMIRFQILAQPHRHLFSLVHRTREKGVIRLYMMEEPYLEIVEVHFDPERMTYFIWLWKGQF